MENEVQPNTPPVQSPPQVPTPPQPTPNRIRVVLIAVLGLIVVAGSVFAGIQIGKKQITDSQAITAQLAPPSPTTELGNDKSTNQTGNVGEWLVYTHTKFPDKPDWKIPWKGFILHYPSSWKIEVTRDDSDPVLDLKITKNGGDYFQIIQGVGDASYCLFKDQPEYSTFDGMATQYTNFKEIKKSNDIVWRLADWPTANDLWTHQLCEEFDSNTLKVGYVGSTIIGFTKIRATTPESIQELNEILNRLEIVN